MLKNLLLACISVILFGVSSFSQNSGDISVSVIRKNIEVLPGEIANIPVQITNHSDSEADIESNLFIPEDFKLITKVQTNKLNPGEQKLTIFTIQIPANATVSRYPVTLEVSQRDRQNILAKETIHLEVGEVEKINMEIVELPDHVYAGETFQATFLIHNLGNTEKKIFIETYNIDNIDHSDLELKPGESSRVTVSGLTSADITDARKEYFRVQAMISGEVVQSEFKSVMVFPSQNNKIDRFYRYPVTFSATYLSTNQQDTYESAYQFELYGNGTLDTDGKHRLEFLARGPNSSELNFLGLYDQYYINYEHKNAYIFLGEKAYTFTPLTESSRFGIGMENRITLNNGLSLGFLYVKPRYYEQIKDEIAIYTGYEKDRYNSLDLYFVSKNEKISNETTFLGSIDAKLRPFERTTLELELSRGVYNNIWDNALRANLNTQFSIFRLSGNYIYTGKFYPGYFSNSKFYSGTFSAHLTQKLSLAFYTRQDFTNAQLDTFFVTAPYSKSYQSTVTYNLASRTYLKVYWKEYEKKDRLALDKFHYKTKSVNAQFSRRVRRFDYLILGEYGKTKNYLLQSLENEQTTYRGSLNLSYRFNNSSTVRFFGNWSNINSFVTEEQRNLTAGMSINSQIGKNFKGSFHIQNAYDIDDYYRNRNLMQVNLEYKFLKKHTLALRSFYTIFRQQIDNPEFTMAATYIYKFGIPMKQIIQTGDVTGRIKNDNDEPVEGIVVSMLNKSAITNRHGEFTIKSVSPGNHLISVDRSKMQIDETTDIPNPIEIEVISDQTSVINFRITKGVKIEGNFVVESATTTGEVVKLNNIIVELKNDFEQFRVVTNSMGEFSFPLVRPGNWTVHIYSNSLPNEYTIDNATHNLILKPGDRKHLSIDLQKKQRNIIFKSQGISLSTSESSGTTLSTLKSGTEKPEPVQSDTIKQSSESQFYSIQIGAFENKLTNSSPFLKGEKFDFEKEIDNLNKYFIGKFPTFEEAEKEQKRLAQKFRGAFIVLFKNGEFVKNIY